MGNGLGIVRVNGKLVYYNPFKHFNSFWSSTDSDGKTSETYYALGSILFELEVLSREAAAESLEHHEEAQRAKFERRQQMLFRAAERADSRAKSHTFDRKNVYKPSTSMKSYAKRVR